MLERLLLQRNATATCVLGSALCSSQPPGLQRLLPCALPIHSTPLSTPCCRHQIPCCECGKPAQLVRNEGQNFSDKRELLC